MVIKLLYSESGEWERSKGWLVYKINFFFPENYCERYPKPKYVYIGSSRTNAAHKRWTQGMEEGKSRSYNDKVQEAKHECLQYSIDVVAYDLSKRDARILEYTLINHNKNNLNIRTRPDCEFKIIKE